MREQVRLAIVNGAPQVEQAESRHGRRRDRQRPIEAEAQLAPGDDLHGASLSAGAPSGASGLAKSRRSGGGSPGARLTGAGLGDGSAAAGALASGALTSGGLTSGRGIAARRRTTAATGAFFWSGATVSK